MYTVSELQDAINDLNNGAHTINNVAKLASVYTVLDHINMDRGYSSEYKPPVFTNGYDAGAYDDKVIGYYGDTEFLRSIKGKKPDAVWMLMDELMYTLELVNDALYNSVLDSLDSIN